MIDFSNVEEVKAKLAELNERNIPHMTLDLLLADPNYSYLQESVDKATKEEIDIINEHFSNYCPKGYNDGKDIFSDVKGVYDWCLRHGEMYAEHCMTVTYYHYLILNGTKKRLSFMLQYHPDGYYIDSEKEA